MIFFFSNRNRWYFHMILRLSRGLGNNIHAQQCFKRRAASRPARRACLRVSSAHVSQVGSRSGKGWAGDAVLLHGLPARGKNTGKSQPQGQDWSPSPSLHSLPPWLPQILRKTGSTRSPRGLWLEPHCPVQLWAPQG